MTDSSTSTARLIGEKREARLPRSGNAAALATKVYGVMAVTALATFGTLATIYELFFRPDIFA